jgi:uncharacterized protein (TIGR03435 family)
MTKPRVFVVAFFVLSIAWASHTPGTALRAQASVPPAKVDVATIKRNKEVEGARAGAPAGTPIPPARFQVLPGGRLIAEGMSTLELIREGYGYVRRPVGDVTGGPGWLDVERYDISIQSDRQQFGPPGPFGLLPQDAAEVVRDLLVDRFKVKTHTEKKEHNIFELRMARADRKLGPGLTPSDGSCVGIYAPPSPQPRCPFVLGGGRGFQTGHITMEELAVFFSAFPAISAEVVDKTGLPGAYDVKMSAFIGGGVADGRGAEDPRPQMPSAVQEMLGLKLERVKGMANVLFVDHVERPAEN